MKSYGPSRCERPQSALCSEILQITSNVRITPHRIVVAVRFIVDSGGSRVLQRSLLFGELLGEFSNLLLGRFQVAFRLLLDGL